MPFFICLCCEHLQRVCYQIDEVVCLICSALSPLGHRTHATFDWFCAPGSHMSQLNIMGCSLHFFFSSITCKFLNISLSFFVQQNTVGQQTGAERPDRCLPRQRQLCALSRACAGRHHRQHQPPRRPQHQHDFTDGDQVYPAEPATPG